jgi:microcystin-dependent protein
LVGGVPQKISYQGYVTHADGKLVEDGYYDVKFKLYQNLTEGEALWEELQNLYIGSGLISATLGGITALNFSENMHFLEMEIGGEVLTPRQELTTVFYAFHAESAVNAATANLATKATKSDTATYATTSGSAASATKATNADTASYAKAIVGTTAESHSITGSASSAGTLKLYEDTDDGTNFVSLKAGTMGADVNYILPTADGTSGQFLSTDASGTLSWSTPSGAASIDGLSDGKTRSHSSLFLGTGAGASIDGKTGWWNVGIGDSSLFSNTTADYNTAVGVKSLYSTTTGYRNTALGFSALYSNTAGMHNTAIGQKAMKVNTSGGSNTAIGDSALYSNTTADNNTAIGSGTLSSNTTGTLNTALGVNALRSNTTGNYNTAVGAEVLLSNTTGTRNTASGRGALYSNSTGYDNTASGYHALYSNTTGNYNTASGRSALYYNTTGSNNTTSGYYALVSNTTGVDNTASGFKALYANTTGERNLAIGYQALDAADTEDDNLAIGYDALGGDIAGGEYNVAIGNYSMDALTSGDYNTAVGYNSLTAITTGENNTAAGYNALSSNAGSDNTAIGFEAVQVTSGSNNTGVGFRAINNVESADNNTALGHRAGDVITTGANNIIIGQGSDPSGAAGANQIVIGTGATGHGDNIAVIGNGSNTAIHPHDDNEVDLGSSSYEYKDLYVDGVAYLDAVGFGSTSITLPTADGSADQVIKTDGSGALGWTSISSTPSGAIMMYAGGSVPSGWLFCNGAAVSRSTYSALFSAISTAYGAGDGSSTFNLPDFGGKGPMGYKSDNSKFDALAETSGEETHSLTTAEIPAHTHTYSRLDGGSHSDAGSGGTTDYSSLNERTSGSTGGGDAHNVLDPYLTVNFMIKQ